MKFFGPTIYKQRKIDFGKNSICKACNEVGSLKQNFGSRYLSFCFVPLIGLKKLRDVNCEHCGKSYHYLSLDRLSQKVFLKNEKNSNLRNKFWFFSGLVPLAIGGLFIISLVESNEKEKSSLAVSDFNELKLVDNSLPLIVDINGDSNPDKVVFDPSSNIYIHEGKTSDTYNIDDSALIGFKIKLNQVTKWGVFTDKKYVDSYQLIDDKNTFVSVEIEKPSILLVTSYGETVVITYYNNEYLILEGA